MRADIQKVSQAQVKVENQVIGQIAAGLLVLIAIHEADGPELVKKMTDKILNLRIFSDREGKMNLSALDTKAEILIVSQFTLYGDTTRGNRPSFITAARPDKAKDYYQQILAEFKKSELKVEQGQFQTEMQVSLVNEGPTTIIIDL